tara:strand:- start:21 stop:221 length:201 start_codon:yes stop_codon:yes gene_type:complete
MIRQQNDSRSSSVSANKILREQALRLTKWLVITVCPQSLTSPVKKKCGFSKKAEKTRILGVDSHLV